MARAEYHPSPLRPLDFQEEPVRVAVHTSPASSPKALCAAGSPSLSRGISLNRLAGDGDSVLQRKLHALDRDGDGRLNLLELEQTVAALVKEEGRHHQYRTMAWAVTGLLLFVLLANMGLAYAVVLMSRETTVKGGVLYSLETNSPVEVENPQFMIQDGAMVERQGGEVIETAAATEVDTLTPLFSDDYFRQLKSIHISSPDGASAHFAILGFVRRPDQGVTFLTTAGTVVMGPDEGYHFDDQVLQFLEASDFFGNTTETGGRRLLQLASFSRHCSQSAGRTCYLVVGDFGITTQTSRCKYGDPRTAKAGDFCAAYCAGWNQLHWTDAVCFDTSTATWDGAPAQEDFDFPCNNQAQCHKTSRGCAPSEEFYCCCYSPSPATSLQP